MGHMAQCRSSRAVAPARRQGAFRARASRLAVHTHTFQAARSVKGLGV